MTCQVLTRRCSAIHDRSRMVLCRSVLGLIGHQAPLTPCGGQATGPISAADARRSQRAAALMRLANEGLLVDTSLPQVWELLHLDLLCTACHLCDVRSAQKCSACAPGAIAHAW